MMKMLMLIMLSLTACTPKVTPVAYDCPVLELPPDPVLSVRKLTPNSPLPTVMQYCIADLITEHGWNVAVRHQNERSR